MIPIIAADKDIESIEQVRLQLNNLKNKLDWHVKNAIQFSLIPFLKKDDPFSQYFNDIDCDRLQMQLFDDEISSLLGAFVGNVRLTSVINQGDLSKLRTRLKVKLLMSQKLNSFNRECLEVFCGRLECLLNREQGWTVVDLVKLFNGVIEGKVKNNAYGMDLQAKRWIVSWLISQIVKCLPYLLKEDDVGVNREARKRKQSLITKESIYTCFLDLFKEFLKSGMNSALMKREDVVEYLEFLLQQLEQEEESIYFAPRDVSGAVNKSASENASDVEAVKPKRMSFLSRIEEIDYGKQLEDVSFVLRIKEARNLYPKDENITSDPYCTIEIGGQFWHTRVVYSELNPRWNEEIVFPFENFTKNVVINVWDKDDKKFEASDLFKARYWRDERDQFLGRCEVKIMNLIPMLIRRGENGGIEFAAVERWVPLEKRSKRSRVSGEIKIEICIVCDKLVRMILSKNRVERSDKVRVEHFDNQCNKISNKISHQTYGEVNVLLTVLINKILEREDNLLGVVEIRYILIELCLRWRISFGSFKLKENFMLNHASQVLYELTTLERYLKKDSFKMRKFEFNLEILCENYLKFVKNYKDCFPFNTPIGELDASVSILLFIEKIKGRVIKEVEGKRVKGGRVGRVGKHHKENYMNDTNPFQTTNPFQSTNSFQPPQLQPPQLKPIHLPIQIALKEGLLMRSMKLNELCHPLKKNDLLKCLMLTEILIKELDQDINLYSRSFPLISFNVEEWFNPILNKWLNYLQNELNRWTINACEERKKGETGKGETGKGESSKGETGKGETGKGKGESSKGERCKGER
ncbi:C2 calcium/lipid-binding, CaLB domain-containing protein [Rozella allomycis CSF55]|uniref:C2 calcium/lipid-binding, CaLB domain-containing protein n=1 Tax=Rozella allomycis (strain CSF55) TaxID=988480 RepID=A0A075AWI0_ROZAC|nr:C2 calcium/lipid-binding, CaLB domain-containing protein [Rozella allomycis CSF55]|eukprot:EPZ32919.1 C2 calcium/lipid-binding, CaLB domain-containing protein [Rozella allomycis CSF55]